MLYGASKSNDLYLLLVMKMLLMVICVCVPKSLFLHCLDQMEKDAWKLPKVHQPEFPMLLKPAFALVWTIMRVECIADAKQIIKAPCTGFTCRCGAHIAVAY